MPKGKKVETSSEKEKMDIGKTIRLLRKNKKMSGVELCRIAGDLDPRTLTAIEMGRIVNPSIKTLQQVSRGLGVSISDIFRFMEMQIPENFYVGSQKGSFQLEFQRAGCRIVSLTPFVKDFFCGKMIVSPKRKIDRSLLNHSAPIYISTLVGQFEVQVENQKVLLKEGENLFFNGAFKHSFQNLRHRESVLLLMTAPSFV